MKTKKHVAIVGAGFSGLASASLLAQAGYKVTLIDKHSKVGGRARQFSADGFTFDMGPSWYWMPDVFEHYFSLFDQKVEDLYELIRLNPSYQVIFEESTLPLPADWDSLKNTLDEIEPGSGNQLQEFMDEAAFKYQVGMKDLVYKPGLSPLEFVNLDVLKGVLKLDVFNSIASSVRKRFKDPRIIALLEFPVLFLGAKPSQTPALYSLMNYADMKLGTWYPKGGMVKIVEAMEKIARQQGVEMVLGQEITQMEVAQGSIQSLIGPGFNLQADVIVAAGDYHHFDQVITPKPFRQYSPSYWEKRDMAPSSLLYYIGLDTKLPDALHHNLYFDADFNVHAKDIYDHPKWPDKPLFYLSCTSKSDDTAPEGMENVFILIPSAPGLASTEAIENHYFNLVSERILNHTGMDIRKHVKFKKTFAYQDFVNEYHSFKGNAYGLANTLKQTAFLKPKMKSKRLKNLFFTGQLTVPGPGVPPSLISGQLAAELVSKEFPLS